MTETLNEFERSNTETNNSENQFADSEERNYRSIFNSFLTPNESYEYDSNNDAGLPMRTPFDQLLEFEKFNNLEDIFGDVNPSDNPFTGGSVSLENISPNTNEDSALAGDFLISKEVQISAMDNDASKNNNLLDSFNLLVNTEEIFFNMGSSMTNNNFIGIDIGIDNTDNGNGNNFLGDSEGQSGSNNQANGNGNWFYGNDNQASGNGNWSFGSNNEVNGNGNWSLNEKSGTPFDSIFEGENNPLTGGNPLGIDEESGISADAIGGNNPVFAGGSTIPTPVGEGDTPDTAENPTGNQNIVNGNGNWSFGSDNEVSGNGNWNFGDDNITTNGNGNWNLGDNNEVSGNGNRPSGNDNKISGNSNRITGDGNSINGNRFSLNEDDLNIVGNADRYLQTSEEGNVSLISNESARDSKYTFDFEGVVKPSENSEVDQLLNGGELFEDDNLTSQEIIDRVYGSLDIYDLNNSGTGSLPGSDEVVDGAAGIFPVGEVPTDISPDVLPYT